MNFLESPSAMALLQSGRIDALPQSKGKQAVMDFEALLIEQMFKPSQSALSPQSTAGSLWHQQLYEYLAKQMAAIDLLQLQSLLAKK